MNILVTSTVWRQDHNGFHASVPRFPGRGLNKSSAVTRIYLPPDVNSLLSVADPLPAERELRQRHRLRQAIASAIYGVWTQPSSHCTKGIGRWESGGNDQRTEPDVVMASAGDIPTQETLAAIMLLRHQFPDLRSAISRVDLFKSQPRRIILTDCPTRTSICSSPSISQSSSTSTNTLGSSIGWLTAGRTIKTCMSVDIRKRATSILLWSSRLRTRLIASAWRWTRLSTCPRLQRIGGPAMAKFHNEQIACRNYAFEHGTDRPDVAGWRWPHGIAQGRLSTWCGQDSSSPATIRDASPA